MNSNIQPINGQGNIESREEQTLLAGEMTRNQVVPKGCKPYHNAAQVPLHGSGMGGNVKPILEEVKKVNKFSKETIKTWDYGSDTNKK